MKVINSQTPIYTNNYSRNQRSVNLTEYRNDRGLTLTSYPRNYYLPAFTGSAARIWVPMADFKEEIKPYIEADDTCGILNALNIECNKRADGKIVVEDLDIPCDFFKEKVNFLEDLGIDSQKLMDDIVEIKGYADFTKMRNLKTFNTLERIGGNLDLMYSHIEDLVNLWGICGDANFNHARKLQRFDNLKFIKGDTKLGRTLALTKAQREQLKAISHYEN